jgi:hypothetical protein
MGFSIKLVGGMLLGGSSGDKGVPGTVYAITPGEFWGQYMQLSSSVDSICNSAEKNGGKEKLKPWQTRTKFGTLTNLFLNSRII